MKPLGERLFDPPATAVTELAQFAGPGRNFHQGAARACNGAPQVCYKHPWSTKPYTFAVLFLPRLVGDLFEDDGVAHCHEIMNLAPMQTLAVSGEPMFFGCLFASCFLVALAAFPAERVLALLLDAALLIVVVWIGRPPLPIHSPLQPTKLLLISFQVFAEEREARFS